MGIDGADWMERVILGIIARIAQAERRREEMSDVRSGDGPEREAIQTGCRGVKCGPVNEMVDDDGNDVVVPEDAGCVNN